MPVTIDKPSKYFTAKLFTGNGSTQSITGLEFSPDWIWIKNRDTTNAPRLCDIVRGTGKNLYSNADVAEESSASTLTAFNSDGFSLGTDAGVNGSGNNIVAWCWDGNGSGVSNTAGSITSTVSANTTSGFSIVSYTGTGSAATVGHGLGVAPKMIIVKRRSNTGEWIVYTSVLGSSYGLKLNTTGAQFSADATVWNSTNPTSSVFSIGSAVDLNASSNTYIAYCFAEVKGFSKAFSYVGNGSSDGTFVHLGFRPAWILMKGSNSVTQWRIWDNKRETYNPEINVLKPNTSDADQSNVAFAVDFLSNGFKIRYDYAEMNTSGNTYIGFAVAEQPFVSSKGIVANAR
jgi:hypothetical protein